MNIKTRLTKLEATIDPNVCPGCGTKLLSVAEAGAKIEVLLSEYEQAGCTREQALHLLREDAPMWMRRIGFLPIIPEGHCSGCSTSLRPIAEDARRALARMKERAPTVAAVLD